MAIDFSFEGIGIHASPTNAGISIGDLSGSGLDFHFGAYAPPDGEPGIDIGGGLLGGDLSPTAGPDGALESLLGQQTSDTPETSPAPEANADTASAAPNTFDPDTLSSLTLLGGQDDAAGLDGGAHPFTGL